MGKFWSILLVLLLLGVVAWGQTAEEAEQSNSKLLELYRQGQFKEAIPIAKEALSIREELLGPEHPETTTSLKNLDVSWRCGVLRHCCCCDTRG